MPHASRRDNVNILSLNTVCVAYEYNLFSYLATLAAASRAGVVAAALLNAQHLHFSHKMVRCTS